jgi:hypothetical protein
VVRVIDRAFALLMAIFSVVAFVLSVLAASHDNYSMASYDLLLTYGFHWQARSFAGWAK